MDAFENALYSFKRVKEELCNGGQNTRKVLDKLNRLKVQLEDLFEAEEKDSYKNALEILIKQTTVQIRQVEKIIFPPIIKSNKKQEAVNNNQGLSFDDFDLNSKKGNDEQRYVKYPKLKELKVKPTVGGLSEIAGLDNVKKTLRTMVILPIYQPQLYVSLKPMNCILLYGPPGTGKTRLAHALAAEAKSELYCVSAGSILNKHVGETEQMLKSIFGFLKESNERVVLFFDEIDGLCQQRNDSEQDYTRRLKTELMTHLTEFDSWNNGVIICATNCPWDLDPAFMRRFQKSLYIPLPSRDERIQIINYYLKNTNLEVDLLHWDTILNKTEGFSASDISNLINHALHIPMYELEDAKVWRIIDEKFYTPIGQNEFVENIICSDIHDLPNNSIVARKAEIRDLFEAFEQVKKSISPSVIERFEHFHQVNM